MYIICYSYFTTTTTEHAETHLSTRCWLGEPSFQIHTWKLLGSGAGGHICQPIGRPRRPQRCVLYILLLRDVCVGNELIFWKREVKVTLFQGPKARKWLDKTDNYWISNPTQMIDHTLFILIIQKKSSLLQWGVISQNRFSLYKSHLLLMKDPLS